MLEYVPQRLSKVAKDYGVSLQHIVEFLAAKGHKIDGNPNGKLPEELYLLCEKEYQKDKAAKQEAEKVTKDHKVLKHEPISLTAATKKPELRPKEEEEEIIIKNVPTVSPSEQEKAAAKKTKTAPVPEPKKEEATTIEVIKAKADKIEGPNIMGKMDLESLNLRSKPDKKSKKTKEEEKNIKEKAKKGKGESKKVEVEPSKKEDGNENEVVPTHPKIDKHETQFQKIIGPNIKGKIDLESNRPAKKPVASTSSSTEKDNKKKRKRSTKPTYGGGTIGENLGLGNTGAPSTPQGGGGAGGRKPYSPNQGGGNQRSGGRFQRTPKVELTPDQIQAQIKETLARLSGAGKSKSSKHRKTKRDAVEERSIERAGLEDAEKKTIKVTEFVSANQLAQMMSVPVNEIISTCMSLGLFVSINQRLDAETLAIVAEEFGYKLEFVSVEVQEAIKEDADKPEDLVDRSPIVTVMGHVDHGKTSLLDYIRKTNVIAGEAGGITQHIGAYNVTLENGKTITFLDTPGHEAFTAMRARGAQVTDIAIIVVAADDSVMPQTVEAINHAQAAGVPIVIAINKIDKPGANPDNIRQALSQINILVEEWGGKVQCQEISAKKGQGVELLLDKVLLEAEMLQMKANPNKNATGTVIESELDKGSGYVSTILVEAGTLHVGDIVLAGCFSGKVKALHNERGLAVKDAGPSMPVELLGLSGAPQAGDKFHVMDDEREAREIAAKRLQLQREQGIRTHKHITLDEIGRRLAIGDFKELNVIVKGDVDGSVEALADSLQKLSTEKVQVKIIHKSVGAISESDVLLASASNAIIVGFQVRPSLSARKIAETEQIDIRLYSIIYDAINEIKAAMEGMLAAEFEEKIVCNIEIREVFNITKVGTIAGCMVLDGKVTRNTKVRVIRDGIVVHTGELGSLKRFKDDVKEVNRGFECGLNINGFNDIKQGDIIEGYEMVEVKAKL